MEKIENIINDYLNLTEREIDLILEFDEMNRNIYNEIFLKNEDKIVKITKIDPCKVELAELTGEMYKFYTDEIKRFFKIGYAMAKRED